MKKVEDFTLFIAIVEKNSFYKAAELLKMSSAAVSRQLKSLEQRLKVQLLNRTTRSLSLTNAGAVYLASCRRLEDETNATLRQLQDLNAKPLGLIKITATPTFAQSHLLAAISNFSLEYPDINFLLELGDQSIDIVDSGIDVAVRIGVLQDSRLKSRLLFSSSLKVCASPSYIERYGLPKSKKELSEHQLVLMNHLPSIEKRQQQYIPELVVSDVQKKLIVNDVMSIYLAVISGMGISMLPNYLVQKDLESGRLVELFNGKLTTKHDVYLVFPASDFMPLKTRVFIDYLVAHFKP